MDVSPQSSKGQRQALISVSIDHESKNHGGAQAQLAAQLTAPPIPKTSLPMIRLSAAYRRCIIDDVLVSNSCESRFKFLLVQSSSSSSHSSSESSLGVVQTFLLLFFAALCPIFAELLDPPPPYSQISSRHI